MVEETPLTPAERIALVQNDKARRYGQIVIAFILIGFSLGYLTYYSIYEADDAFLLYLGTGMLALVFAGIGAAYAIMGLGRTVGASNAANNEQIALILEEIAKLKGTSTSPETDEFFEDNRDDNLEEERVDEVPPSRRTTKEIAAANVAPGELQYLADRDSWHKEVKTINGKPVAKIATQESRRSKKKRTVYVYHIIGTNIIIYNRSRHGIFFMKIAYRPQNMLHFYDTFVNPPLTKAESDWLARNDYVLI